MIKFKKPLTAISIAASLAVVLGIAADFFCAFTVLLKIYLE